MATTDETAKITDSIKNLTKEVKRVSDQFIELDHTLVATGKIFAVVKEVQLTGADCESAEEPISEINNKSNRPGNVTTHIN